MKKIVFDNVKEPYSLHDMNYSYNRVSYSGYLSKGEIVEECTIEIYHLGELVFCEQTDDDHRSMKEIIR